MKITQALALAKSHIYVGYHGGHYVAQPYGGLKNAGGPTLAPSSTTTYAMANAFCRARRISEVVRLVTGDDEYADSCEYDAIDGKNSDPDWRIVARRFVRQHKELDA